MAPRSTTVRHSASRRSSAGRVDTERHAGLDRDEVVDAALALVESRGGTALTMRKLAAELGVAPTAIYWHVGNRDELVAAVVGRQAERQASAVVTGTTAAERIGSAAINIWENALAHRNVTALASGGGVDDPAHAATGGGRGSRDRGGGSAR
ncbi:MAG: TetR family transcriptional regulator [Microthrixaceae bacterium]